MTPTSERPSAPAPEHRPEPRVEGVFIGNQTAFSAATLMEPFEYAVANRFDAFEWFPDKGPGGAGWGAGDLETAQRALIRRTAEYHALRLSLHAHWTINPLEAATAPVLQRDLELARDLGAAVVVLHLYTEAGLPAYARALLPPLHWASAHGLQLAIENTVRTGPTDFNELFAALRQLASPELPRVGMCLDLGHANLCAATRNDYLDFIDRLEPEVPIIHVHAHENWGDADTHLPLFTGPAARSQTGVRGFVDRMRRREYSGSVILEQWPQPPSLLNDARDALRRIWNEPADRLRIEAMHPRPTTAH